MEKETKLKIIKHAILSPRFIENLSDKAIDTLLEDINNFNKTTAILVLNRQKELIEEKISLAKQLETEVKNETK